MKLLEVARIGKAHGLKGEVSVHLISNILERVDSGSVLFLQDRLLMDNVFGCSHASGINRFLNFYVREA